MYCFYFITDSFICDGGFFLVDTDSACNLTPDCTDGTDETGCGKLTVFVARYMCPVFFRGA